MECIVGIKIWMSRNVLLLNSFTTKFSMFLFSLLYARGRSYTSPERVQNHSIKNTDEEDADTSDLIYKHMHMKNNVIIDDKLHINENCLMLQSEMWIQKV